jgi:hypothetical protein
MKNQSFLQQIREGDKYKKVTINLSIEAAEKLIDIVREECGLYWVYYDGNKTPHLTTDAGLDFDLPCKTVCCDAWVDIAHLWGDDAPDALCPHCGDVLSLGSEADNIQFECMLEQLDKQRAKIVERTNER